MKHELWRSGLHTPQWGDNKYIRWLWAELLNYYAAVLHLHTSQYFPMFSAKQYFHVHGATLHGQSKGKNFPFLHDPWQFIWTPCSFYQFSNFDVTSLQRHFCVAVAVTRARNPHQILLPEQNPAKYTPHRHLWRHLNIQTSYRYLDLLEKKEFDSVM